MKTILVIEDEEAIRENIVELLEAEHFSVIAAETGQQGIQRARAYQPDLILCDIVLPDIDGYQVLSQIRQDPDTSLIPLIFVTAKADKTDIRQGMTLGADDYLTKPFTRAELLTTITTRLNKRDILNDRYATVLRHAAERLNRLVHYDSLTDLPNHLLFRERLQQAIRAVARQEQPVALLYLSLNRLNQINNLLGYPCGDELLRAVAHRLIACVAQGDTIARLTGSQFAIILTEVRDRQDILSTTQLILNALAHPFQLPEQEVFITVSIGIALYPEHGQDVSTLLRQADAAMQRAKHQKGNHYQLYAPSIELMPDNQISLETSLRYALQRDEFQIYYQPQVSLQTGQLEGVEALIRWYHPVRGMVSPTEFIPLAEETGLIVPIGEWALETACLQAKRWQRNYTIPLRMSVNISGYQFSQPDLTTTVARTLEKTGLEPKFLELELTETTLMQNAEVATSVLSALKQLGVRIAIDDFGTGYSSLSYLKQFPIDALKIDHCFIRNLIGDAKNIAITTAVIQMAHNLNLNVIAEGVETEAELKFLYQHQCDVVQGYLIGHPLSPAEFEPLMMAHEFSLSGNK